MNVTDEVNEEFILAEQAYVEIKERVQRELEAIKIRFPAPQDVSELHRMRGRLEAARVRLKNAAMELTRVELENAKGFVVQAVKSEQEMIMAQRRAEELEERIREAREKLANAEEETGTIMALVKEMDDLKSYVLELKRRRETVENGIRDSEKQLEPVNNLNNKIVDSKVEIAGLVKELRQVQEQFTAVAAEYEQTEPDRAKHLAEQQRLEKEFEMLTVSFSKLKDDIFLLSRGKERRLGDVENARKAIQEIDDEIAEVKRFPLHKIEPLDEEAIRTDLRELDEYCVQLAVEIERLREERFRQRTKI
jgi:chromosome segregation ATPase